ncbi:hypothetical protein BU15DRAFT_71907 [Melanogaster broomeanus]|nr:hypothetical protein BU15DRAFT_71907 [Melanogaster broomeanus]
MSIAVTIQPHIYRRGTSSGEVNHTTTTIIIIVVCVIGGFAILFALVRFLYRSCRRKSVPLPPKQEIAYYRERHLAELTDQSEKPTSTVGAPTYSLPHGLSPAGSATSLFHAKEGGLASEASAYLLDGSDPSGTPQCRSPHPCGPLDLHTPNPSFGQERRRNSSSSRGSNYSIPLSPSSSSLSRTRTTSIPRRHRRPSTVSTNSVRSRSTIVGVPHGPHNQIKIVTPAPLAPALRPYATGPSTVHTSDGGHVGT